MLGVLWLALLCTFECETVAFEPPFSCVISRVPHSSLTGMPLWPLQVLVVFDADMCAKPEFFTRVSSAAF